MIRPTADREFLFFIENVKTVRAIRRKKSSSCVAANRTRSADVLYLSETNRHDQDDAGCELPANCRVVIVGRETSKHQDGTKT